MRLIFASVLALALAAAGVDALESSPGPPQGRVPTGGSAAPSADSAQALLKRYCVTCHNEQLETAGLALDRLDLENVGHGAETWEKVVAKLRAGQMPPAGRPRPEQAAHDTFVSWLETELDQAAAAQPNPGRPVVRRLNRLEYTNAIRDLLALDVDGPALLPTDESGYGFDNVGDVLSVSPSLLERYMSAAQKISRRAIGDPTLGVSRDTYLVPKMVLQADRMSEDLPFGSRGGAVFRHTFPVDGEYELRVRLKEDLDTGAVQGLKVREQVDVRLDGERLELFVVGGECVGSDEPHCVKPPGRAQASQYQLTADESLNVSFAAEAGARLIGVSFLKHVVPATEGAGPDRRPTGDTQTGDRPQMSVERLVIEGPFNVAGSGDTASRRRIFVCRPVTADEEEPCAREILGALAQRAYRRAVTAQDLDPLLEMYRPAQAIGGFEVGIQVALEMLLVSPDFLLRLEQEPVGAVAGTVYPVSDVDLASRLAFFLWSSIPDDELLDAAIRGDLSNPGVLEQQVRRMLADSRASTLVSNFASQWLHLRDLEALSPDTRIFREFDESLRRAFVRETELVMESQRREDRSVLELLTADYTFVNERLARFYGIPNVYGSHFRRVKQVDPNRRGVLGHGSILTVTSYANRTSPVQRGLYVLDNILGSPPPAPPPNVEGLQEAAKTGEPATSVRERMEAHRANPVCASCHAQMDPIGFALETFDGIGKWRDTDLGLLIDPAGALPDGTEFNGPAALWEALAQREDLFVGNVVDRLLTYALGRGVEYYDKPAIRQIVREAAPDYRWSSLILGVVNSAPFRTKSADAMRTND